MRNGLYSLHIDIRDGLGGINTGVMVLRDGTIRGGDSHFYYIGSYSFAGGKWKGELTNHEHTPTYGARPVFGGRDSGIGFTGTYDDAGAVADATALVGTRSVRFTATMKRLADA